MHAPHGEFKVLKSKRIIKESTFFSFLVDRFLVFSFVVNTVTVKKRIYYNIYCTGEKHNPDMLQITNYLPNDKDHAMMTVRNDYSCLNN